MVTLYYAPDNASLIVRILLEELKQPYEAVLVDRSVQAQSSPEYLKLNPDGLIPVCIIDGQPVFETAAILLSLADKHGKFVVTADDLQRPQFLKWLFFLSNSVHSDLRQLFYPEKFVGDDEAALQKCNALTVARLDKRLSLLDAAYSQAGSTYLFGAEPTIIDFYLATGIRWAQLYPAARQGQINSADYASISAMLKSLEVRDAVVGACGMEGIVGAFFSDPGYADPVEGVAL